MVGLGILFLSILLTGDPTVVVVPAAPTAQQIQAIQAAATQPAATQPTTQPIAQQVVVVDSSGSTLNPLMKTRLAQWAEGKQRVSLHDVMEPEFWIASIQDLIVAVIAFIPRLVVAFFFLVAFWLTYRGIRRVVLGSMGKAHVDQSIRDMLGHIIKWAIMGFGLVIACNQIGVQITALLTGVSIIGLAIGFAAQETLANFIAGIVIFWDKPFRVGEWITVDGLFARVSRVTFRSTRLLNLEGETLIFPNTYMLSNRVLNHSSHPETRVSVPITLASSVSIHDTRQTLLGLIKGDERVRQEPAPEMVVEECTPATTTILLRFWVQDEALLRKLRHEYLEKAKLALDAVAEKPPTPAT